MKGLAIYVIVITSFMLLGGVANIISNEDPGTMLILLALETPVLVFACIFVAKNYKSM